MSETEKKPEPVFKLSHDHRKKTGRPKGVYVRDDQAAAIDAGRGRKSFSLALAEVVDKGLRAGNAAMSPILRDARVQHVAYANRTTKRLTIERTVVRPSKKTAADIGDPGRGNEFSVKHDVEVSPSSEVRGGDHFLDPDRCLGCLLAVRDCRM